jgi:hypothetical protein
MGKQANPCCRNLFMWRFNIWPATLSCIGEFSLGNCLKRGNLVLWQREFGWSVVIAERCKEWLLTLWTLGWCSFSFLILLCSPIRTLQLAATDFISDIHGSEELSIFLGDPDKLPSIRINLRRTLILFCLDFMSPLMLRFGVVSRKTMEWWAADGLYYFRTWKEHFTMAPGSSFVTVVQYVQWQCPICLKNYSLENLMIDPYFNWITSLVGFHLTFYAFRQNLLCELISVFILM